MADTKNKQDSSNKIQINEIVTAFNKPTVESLSAQVSALINDLKALNDEFYLNNFSAYQIFNKYSNFTSRLKIPYYASAPATCEVGEIIEVGGKLKICSSSNVWTTVGTQT